MIAVGGLSGVISSSIAGGKFSDGFKQGLITSGLNHFVHIVSEQFSTRLTRQESLERIKAKYLRFYEVLSKLPEYLKANPNGSF